MTISGINTSSIYSSLLAQTGQSTTSSSSSSSTSSSTSGSDSAYTLSLGQQQATTSLLAYSQLGKLTSAAEANFDKITKAPIQQAITDGGGKAISRSYTVDVTQLAMPQVLSATGSDLGTGTLSFQFGSYDSATNAFTASGSPATVTITDGSPSGIAKAINDAGIGIAAKVVTNGDQSTLQIGGASGAANAFTVSGISGLDYDPTDPAASGLSALTHAADAEYTVNGGSQQSSASNTGVAIASGVVTDFTATGSTTVSAPLDQNIVSTNANLLVGTFNSMLDGLTQVGDKTSSDLAKSLGEVAAQSFGGKSLADIGISQATDGTLSIDGTALQAAFTADPAGTSKLLDRVAAAIRDTLKGSNGADVQIKSQMQTLVHSLMQGKSLIDYLNSASSGSDSSSPFSGSATSSNSQVSELLAQLNGTSSSSSSSSSTLSQLEALLQSNASSSGGSGDLVSQLSALLSSSSTASSSTSSDTASTLAQLLASVKASS